MDWENKKIKDIANVTMGQSPSSKYYNTKNEGMPFLQGNKTFGKKYPYYETYTESTKKIAKKGEVLISVRAPVGDLNVLQKDTCIGRGLSSLNMKNNENEFLYYLLKANIIKLLNSATGTVFTSINKKDLENLEIKIPDNTTQKQITSILKKLDDKIDILTKLNQNLRLCIKNIIEFYFEFKGSFEKNDLKESEIGFIPSSWELFELKDIAKISNGYSYKGVDLEKSDNAMVTIKNFDRKGGFKLDGFKEINISDRVKPHHYVDLYDVVIASTDLTQNAEIIGNTEIILNKSSYKNLIISMDLIKIETKKPEINNFLLHGLLNTQRFKHHALGYVNGTTVLHLDKKGVPKYKIALPSNLELCKKVGNIIKPFYI